MRSRFFIFISILTLLVLPVQEVFATVGVPKVINYQGRLLDASGNLLGGSSGTNYCFRFGIYDALSSGTKLWPATSPATTTVSVKNGIFDYGIGSGAGGGDTSVTYNFNDSDTIYLNIDVANSSAGSCAGASLSWETLSPRKQIFASGYAINASTVTNGVYTTTFGGLFDARLSATTTLPGLTTLAGLTTIGTVISGTWSAVVSGGTINSTPIGASAASTAVFTNATSTTFATTNLAVTGTASMSALTVSSDTTVGGTLGVTGLTTLGYASTTQISSTNSAYFATTGGNVGIGTTSPTSLFTVVGGGACFSGTSATIVCGNTAGNLYYRTANTGTYDVAENYTVIDTSIEAGDIVSLDASSSLTVVKATSSSFIIGIISSDPGLVLGGADAQTVASTTRPVALSGRVPTKVNLEGGSIAIGDRITISSTTGIGMKATTSTVTVGIALEAFDGTIVTAGGTAYSTTGKIIVFVNLSSQQLSQDIANGMMSTDLQGQEISNVKSILSSSGKWSINEDGFLVIEELRAKRITVESGMTVRDRKTGNYNCISVEDGVIKIEAGECPLEQKQTTIISVNPIAESTPAVAEFSVTLVDVASSTEIIASEKVEPETIIISTEPTDPIVTPEIIQSVQ